jgi:3-phosphoshikimate 1-carboxyvinyltransferase
VIIKAGGLEGGSIRMRGDLSSQFLSAIMMIAPLARSEVCVSIDGLLVSAPYVEMTAEMLRSFGAIEILSLCNLKIPFSIPLGPDHAVSRYAVEPDATAAGYLFGAAAIAAGELSIPGLRAASIQGDVCFAGTLVEMGCTFDWGNNALKVTGNQLNGIDADMNEISDCVPTLAAVACFAEGPTTIRNVAHIRHKESDRIAALATELHKVGAEVEEFPDGLKITPRPLHGAEIETYNDHRIAMSMALIGLKVPGIIIKNPGCVAKTYPGFWDDLEKLRERN